MQLFRGIILGLQTLPEVALDNFSIRVTLDLLEYLFMYWAEYT